MTQDSVRKPKNFTALWINMGGKKWGDRQITLLLSILLSFFISACSDPYTTKLPTDGRLTAGEVEKVVSKLQGADKETFKRWATRQAKNDIFGGEGTAPNVKIALLNQAIYETRRQEEFVQENARKAEEARMARQREQDQRDKQAQLDQVAAERQLVNTEILKVFSADAVGYEFRPLTDYRGYEVGRQWVFKLKLVNRSNKDIVGAAGWINITDVFGADLGSYLLRIEPRVNARRTIEYFAVMDHNRKDPQKVAMTQARLLKVYWFFESVAFSDGSVMDYRTINSSNSNNNISTPGKSTGQKVPVI